MTPSDSQPTPELDLNLWDSVHLASANSCGRMFKAIAQHGPMALVLVSGPDLILEFANPEATRIVPFELVKYESLYKYAPLELRAQLKQAMLTVLTKGRIQLTGHKIALSTKPSEIYFNITGMRVELDDNTPGALFLWQETTETVYLTGRLEQLVEQRTQDIRKAYSFVNAVIENIPDMIFIKEAQDLRFVRFNKAGEALLGFKRKELLGKNDYDFFPEHEADFFVRKDREVLEKGEMLEIPEESIQTKFGTRFLHTKKIPLYNEDGEAEYLVGISQDITQKKLGEEAQRNLLKEQVAREEAEKALRLRDEFLSVVGHELRTPLSALMLIVQLLERKLQESELAQDESLRPLGKLIKKSQLDLGEFAHLVEDLLDVSRISTGRLSIEKVEVDLNAIIQKSIARYEGLMLKAGCTLQTEICQGVVGHWDPMRIEQVISNLLSNAMKYGAGKPIILKVCTEDQKVIISIQDFGIGITPEQQPKIFERFERAVSSRDFGGFGLGLYISKQLVLAHGGSICVHSALDQGSTFVVELPLK